MDVSKKVSSNMIYGVLNFILLIFSLVNAYVNKKYKNSLILIYFIIFFNITNIFSNNISMLILVTTIAINYFRFTVTKSEIQEHNPDSIDSFNLLFYNIAAPTYFLINYYLFDRYSSGHFYLLKNRNSLPWLETSYVESEINKLPILLIGIAALYLCTLYFNIKIINADSFKESKYINSSNLRKIIWFNTILFTVILALIISEVYRMI